jgi:hypothetical protein
MSIHLDVPRPFATGEQLVGDDLSEVFERSVIKDARVTPSKFPGVSPPQSFPALGGDASILGPHNLTANRLDHRHTNQV